MAKRISFQFILIVLLTVSIPTVAFAASRVLDLRVDGYEDRVRIVLDMEGGVRYSWERAGNYIQISLPDTSFNESVEAPLITKKQVLDKVDFRNLNGSAKLYITLNYPSYCEIFSLTNPNKLVIDLRRDIKEFDRRVVARGMEYFRIAKINGNGPMVGSVLKVDPKYYEVAPALASGDRHEPGFFDSLVGLFNPILPWVGEKITHFFRERVTSIAEREGALAAVNGTYFGRRGEPLGILMIDGEIVTSPIYDRTALVISDDGAPAIDNVFVNTYFEMPDGVKIDITGLNQLRSPNDVILYTSKYGRKTGTKNCSEIIVRNDKVWEIRGANSEIPPDGFVISAGKNLEKLLRDRLDSGEEIKLNIEIIPYSTESPGSLRHIIGGGPRLLKAGRVYVSKKEEKFRWDVARTRAARTAVGITKDGHLLFVTIDKTSRIGRKPDVAPSAGMKLEELSEFMIFLGAVDAMNLDGGGSSTMVVSGEVVNMPANGHEIAISNAILLKPKL
jgi:exopolysaccharide biosynthesis protein